MPCFQDAFEMILAGASAVQVGTCHWTEGPKCFDRICAELSDIMKEKGYSKVSDFKGKLKDWSKEGASISREAKKSRNQLAAKTKDSNTAQVGVTDFYQLLSGLLSVLLAILLADKLGLVNM